MQPTNVIDPNLEETWNKQEGAIIAQEHSHFAEFAHS